MPLDIPIRKNRPLSRMFPAIIPSRFGKFRTGTVDSLDGSCIADAIVVWSNPHNRTVLLVQPDVVMLETAVAETVEVPDVTEARPEWTRDVPQRRYEGLGYSEEDLECYEENGEQEEDELGVHGGGLCMEYLIMG
jgi:hypothetical protein